MSAKKHAKAMWNDKYHYEIVEITLTKVHAHVSYYQEE